MPITGWLDIWEGDTRAVSTNPCRSWWHSQGLRSWLLPPGNGKQGPRQAGNTTQGPSSHLLAWSRREPQGGGGVPARELTSTYLKYTMALVVWPLWVQGAVWNNTITDKGRNPDTLSTKGLFLFQWGKAAFPHSTPQDLLFSKHMNGTQWFFPALPSCLFLIPATTSVGRSQHAVPPDSQKPNFHDSVVGNNWNISE